MTSPAMTTLFISHSSKDDTFVGRLQRALADLNVDAWTDSRKLHGGDSLEPAIKKAIEDASAFAVVATTDSLQSVWVVKELRYALNLQKQRGEEAYRVVVLLLDGTKPDGWKTH